MFLNWPRKQALLDPKWTVFVIIAREGLCALGLLGCGACELPTASPHFGGTGVLWVLTGTHPCGPPPRQNGGGDRNASSCCGFVEWFVVVMNVSGIGMIRVRIPTPLHGEWAAPASHRIRSPSPRVPPPDCSQSPTVRTAARHTVLTPKCRLLIGRLGLSCTRHCSCTLN